MKPAVYFLIILYIAEDYFKVYIYKCKPLKKFFYDFSFFTLHLLFVYS